MSLHWMCFRAYHYIVITHEFYGLPHVTVLSKDLTDKLMIHIRWSEGIVHGHILYGHFDYNQWPKRATTNSSQISQLLLYLCKRPIQNWQFSAKMLYKLYIQLDIASAIRTLQS
jgi:hypothetical protein